MATKANVRTQDAAAQSKGKQVVPAAGSALTNIVAPGMGVAVPEHIKQGLGRGRENVKVEDILIPRIEIAQALSPCLKKSDPAYIEGASQGDLYNTVTRQLYGPHVAVCPVHFSTQYLVWKDRDLGGGFRGAFNTLEEANARITEEEKPEEFEAVETKQYVVLVLDDATGTTSEAIVSMAKTKLKVSRDWQGKIAAATGPKGDIFGCLYNLFSVDAKNDKGQEFKNFGIQTIGYTPVPIYQTAEQLYSSIDKGKRKVAADYSDAGIDASVVGDGKADY